MSVIAFLFLLTIFSTATSLIVEAIKRVMDDKENLAYNVIVLCVALVVGFFGTLLYFYLTNTVLDMVNIIFAILMGLASCVGAMVGYDRVKQCIEQIGSK